MNKLILLFGVLLCTVAINARHYRDRSDAEGSTYEAEEEFRKPKEHEAGPMRHRRRRWQPSNFGYDYQPPNPFYQDRREYDRNNREYDRNYRDYDRNFEIQQILKLLDEISTLIKRAPTPPPPPPQPIYIPYPVPYPVPQYTACSNKKTNITFPVRWPQMADINQNWGFVVPISEDDNSDGARPISFDPIKEAGPMPRPTPEVEHGSSEGKQQSVTEAPTFTIGMCNAVILSCCGMNDKTQQRQCFTSAGCSISYKNGQACNRESIVAVLDSFKTAYSPVN